MAWHLVRQKDGGAGVVAYPDPALAEHEATVNAGLEVVPVSDPRPLLEEEPEPFARLAPIKPPMGLEQIRAFVGFDPEHHVTDDGRVSPLWETSKIQRLELPAPLEYLDGRHVTRVACHERIVPAAGLAFEAIMREGLWHVLEPYAGGFVARLKRSTSTATWSTHTFGLAFDFNPSENGLGVAANQTRFGSTDEGQRVVELFDLHGFYWGGRFRRPDAMHFQFCRGY